MVSNGVHRPPTHSPPTQREPFPSDRAKELFERGRPYRIILDEAWCAQWKRYIFSREDWRAIPEDFLFKLISRGKSRGSAPLRAVIGERARAFQSILDELSPGRVQDVEEERLLYKRLHCIWSCLRIPVVVEEGGKRVARVLPVEAQEDFLRGARMFLALRKLGKTSDNQHCFMVFIREISEVMIADYWRAKSEEKRKALFSELMPALVEQPGFRFHPEHKTLAGKVARILFLTLYNSMFGKDNWECPCGKTHRTFGLKIPPIIRPGAVKRLVGVLDTLRGMDAIRDPFTLEPRRSRKDVRVALVSGKGPKTKKHVDKVRALLVSAGYSIVCEPSGSDCTVNLARAAAQQMETYHANVVINVGGGTSNDVAKLGAHLAYHTEAEKNFPERIASRVAFVSVPTVLSHDGLASKTASLKESATVAGKKSISATAPLAVLVDIDIVSKGTGFYTAAGFGDALKLAPVASMELAALFNALGPKDGRKFVGSGFCPFVGSLLVESSKNLLDNAVDLKRAMSNPGRLSSEDVYAFRRLARYLIASACSTGALGDTTMISQGEHLISHHIDLAMPADDRRTHGGQVAVASLLLARIHEELTGMSLFGVSWQELRQGLEVIGAPVSAANLEISDEAFIDLVLGAQAVRPERFTFIYSLFRVFDVDLPGVAGEPLVTSRELREMHVAVPFLNTELTGGEREVISRIGVLGQAGLRKFVEEMARDAGVIRG